MDVTIYEQSAEVGLHGTAELWLRYRGDQVIDLPRVIDNLTAGQKDLMNRTSGKPLAYYPALADDGEPNPYRYEDWWVFRDNGGSI